jgi:hypothetical protein
MLAGERLFVFNHRADRPLRLRQFAQAPIWLQPGDTVMVTGDAPDVASRRAVRCGRGEARLHFVSRRHLTRTLRERLVGDAAIGSVVICGNTRQIEVSALVAAVTDPGTGTRVPASAGMGA